MRHGSRATHHERGKALAGKAKPSSPILEESCLDVRLASSRRSPRLSRAARIDGKEYIYPDQLAWPGIATLPGLPSTDDRLRAGRTAGRRADRRALAGGPDAAEAGRTDRARI